MEPVILVLPFQVRELSAEVLGRATPGATDVSAIAVNTGQHDATVGRNPLEVLAHAVEFL